MKVAVAALAALGYGVLGLLVLYPDTLFSVDAAVKLLQARALLDSGLQSLSIPYPAAGLDPAFEFFPFAQPFVFKAAGSWHGVFPSAVALFNAAWLPVGAGGVVLASALGGGIALGVMSSVKTNAPAWAVPLVLGIGTSFWFYCVLPWEHVPALALSTAAWGIVLGSTRRSALTGAALALGTAIVLREESLLLTPGFMWALWTTRRDLRGCMAFALVLMLPFVLLLTADVVLFHRPPAAHVAQLSELLAGSVGSSSNIRIEPAWPMVQRAQTVLQDWLLGRAGWSYSVLILALIAGVGAFRRHAAAAVGVLTLAMLCLVQLGQDLSTMLPHPDFPPGLLRLSPFLILAFVPVAVGQEGSTVRRLGLLTSTGYLVGVLASLSMTGGASLGPRLLLPILPLLCHAACEGLWSYRQATTRAGRPIWVLGLLLLAGSVAIQVGVAMRAYITFNHDEHRAVERLRASSDPVIVIDSPFTMSVTEPVYLTRQVMMADTPAKAARLSVLLQRQSVPTFRLVSRELTQPFDFAPYRLVSVERFPVTTIQQWALPPDRHDGKPQ